MVLIEQGFEVIETLVPKKWFATPGMFAFENRKERGPSDLEALIPHGLLQHEIKSLCLSYALYLRDGKTAPAACG